VRPAGDEFEDDADELERRVGEMIADAFPVAGAAVQDAHDALQMRTCTCALLALAHDTQEAPGARADGVRSLLFRGHGIAVEMTVTETGDRCDLVGRVRPPHPCSAAVVTADRTFSLHDAGDGSFRGRRIPRRPSTVLLRIRDGGRRPRYRTEWTAL
jgi:hypothetical protein